jgi:hypothetical protein
MAFIPHVIGTIEVDIDGRATCDLPTPVGSSRRENGRGERTDYRAN